MEQFTDKVALVTGAASGIGRTSAQFYAREGAKVVVSDINDDGGQETVRLIKQAGGEALFIKTDVSNPADCENLVIQTVEKYGRLDYACNNAGIGGEQNFTRVAVLRIDHDTRLAPRLPVVVARREHEEPIWRVAIPDPARPQPALGRAIHADDHIAGTNLVIVFRAGLRIDDRRFERKVAQFLRRRRCGFGGKCRKCNDDEAGHGKEQGGGFHS